MGGKVVKTLVLFVLLACRAGAQEPVQVPTETREIEAEAESSAVLVHHCLRELLHLAEDGLMPLSVTATACEDPPRAKLTAQVVPVGKIRDRLLSEVKAVTYHNLELRREGDWLVMDLVFDT